MEIEARSRMDMQTLRAVNALVYFRGKDPKKSIKRISILLGICAGLLLLSQVLMMLLGDSLPPWMFVIMGICCLAPLLDLYFYYLIPKRQHKRLGKLADIEGRYLFREKELCVMADGEDGFHSDETLPYAMLHALKETNDYFFIFLDKSRMFPVDKLSLSATEVETVRTWLSAVLPYKLCNY